ncbi:sensor histidine kinase [Nitriliruptor alkaliphilus]|uniref:sensor histidine kinase n=1 Tax=Nitriliruptor alkaliphilus TaxID=427918 RepID=UPI0014707D91|nr:ATP-binding protein [Nitriliruptor alkaliphilus]
MGEGQRAVEMLVEALRWLQTIGFVVVAAWAIALWRRRRDDQSRWLAATFASLGFVVLTGRVFEEPDSLASVLMVDLLIAVLVSFPYLLIRFLDSFEPVPRSVQRAVGLGVLALIVATPAVDVVGNADAASPSLPFTVYALAIAGSWLLVLPAVAVRFWRAGRQQPTLPRRRLQLLSTGVFLLSIALAMTVVDGDDGGAGSLAIQALAVVLVLVFLVGFAPPRWLRRVWRHSEEQALQSAAVGLMAATSPEEVGEVVVPHMRALVGARAVAVIDRGRVVGVEGLTAGEVAVLERSGGRPPEATSTLLSHGEILTWLDRFTPFFGEEEVQLLDRIGLLIDLALHRTALLVSEREARTQLERTNAELESFVYSASHDLKSPLIAMLSYVDLLVDEHRDRLDGEAQWYLDRLVTNGRYMESLIGDLLELSRVGRTMMTPERVVLAELVEDVATEVRGANPGAAVTCGHLPVLWVNGTRMRQLLQNLLENAVKHGPERVQVEVTAETATDAGVVLVVRDNGPGIPVAYRERVFGVFERLEVQDATSGTGIGLAICRKVVESLGGRIWLGDPDDGAEFRIHLPASVLAHDAASTEEIPA